MGQGNVSVGLCPLPTGIESLGQGNVSGGMRP